MNKFATLVLYTALPLMASGQVQRVTGRVAPKPQLPSWVTTPTDIPQKQSLFAAQMANELRSRRAQSHLRQGDQATPLDAENVPSTEQRHSASFSDRLEGPRPLPSKDSDLIILGDARKVDQFLSPDHRHIYDELTFTPVHTFKGTHSPNGVIVRQEGGSLKLPNHKVAYDPPPSGSYPLSMGVQYVLFLKYLPATEDYIVLSAWALQENPVLLDANGKPVPAVASNYATPELLFAGIQHSVAEGAK